jgi:hypothetical protein
LVDLNALTCFAEAAEFCGGALGFDFGGAPRYAPV